MSAKNEKKEAVVTSAQEVSGKPTDQPSSKTPDQLMGSDETSLTVISNIVVQDRGEILRGKALFQRTMDFINDDSTVQGKEDAKARLERGSDLSENFFKSLTASSATVEAVHTNYVIMLGKMLLKMKKYSRKAGRYFGDFASEHLDFIPERTRQRYMRLASREDAHKYVVLGIERLLFLISETQDQIGTKKDPIKDLFEKHGLTFDPESGEEIEDFQHRVNVAIVMAKLEKRGIRVDRENVSDYMDYGGKIDANVMKQLKMVQSSGGNPDQHLANVGSADPDDDMDESDRKKKVEGFNKLSIRMSSTISYIVEHPNLVSNVEIEKLEVLQEDLDKLRALLLPLPAEDVVTDEVPPDPEESVTEEDPPDKSPTEDEDVVRDADPPEAPPSQ